MINHYSVIASAVTTCKDRPIYAAGLESGQSQACLNVWRVRPSIFKHFYELTRRESVWQKNRQKKTNKGSFCKTRNINVTAPCELPLLHGATYEAGYRAGLTVAHASSVNIACDMGRSPPATLNCHLGRLQPTVHDFCRPLGQYNNFLIDKPSTSETLVKCILIK